MSRHNQSCFLLYIYSGSCYRSCLELWYTLPRLFGAFITVSKRLCLRLKKSLFNSLEHFIFDDFFFVVKIVLHFPMNFNSIFTYLYNAFLPFLDLRIFLNFSLIFFNTSVKFVMYINLFTLFLFNFISYASFPFCLGFSCYCFSI